MFQNKSDLDAAFAEAELPPAFADAVARLCVPALALVKAEAGGPGTPDVSRLGGAPDLPTGLGWPVRPPYVGAGNPHEPTVPYPDMREAFATPAPLHFIGQLDLAAVARAGALKGRLPRHGRLLFFWDPKHGTWIDSAASCRVIHDRSPVHALAPRTAPAEFGAPDEDFDIPPLFAPKAVSFLRVMSMPDQHLIGDLATAEDEQELLKSLDSPKWEDEWEALWDLVMDIGRAQLLSGEEVLPHRLGGWPMPEQGDPRYDAAASALGIGTKPSEADRARARAAMHDWTLLAQIELNDLSRAFAEGVVYFVMRRDDLEAENFDRVHATYQQT